jgi:hypothetical protein
MPSVLISHSKTAMHHCQGLFFSSVEFGNFVKAAEDAERNYIDRRGA